MDPIDCRHMRYIKLGEGGAWAEAAIERGQVPFGYAKIPHEVCLAGDWDAVGEAMTVQYGREGGRKTQSVREVRDYYTLGGDCLWITFARRRLWWAFAAPEVTWVGTQTAVPYPRARRTVDGWHDSDITGQPLLMDALSSNLTQLVGYRQTICKVAPQDYALRRINGAEEPALARAREARAAMIGVATEMIANLHWADFETLIDLIFARGGWQRVSRLGETQRDVDLIVEQPTTGECAFVQVKSRANQAVLDDYVDRFREAGIYDRMFFTCHSPRGALQAPDGEPVHLWIGEQLAEAAVKAGLFDWVVAKS